MDALRAELEARKTDVILEWAPPLDDAQLAELEKAHGPLPDAYRAILGTIGPFADDCGFELGLPTHESPGEFPVSRQTLDEWGAEALERFEAARSAGQSLFSPPAVAFDTVWERRPLRDLAAPLDDLGGESPGITCVASLSGVAGDLYLVLRGETRGTIWFESDTELTPELYVRDGEVVFHDCLSWALSFAGL